MNPGPSFMRMMATTAMATPTNTACGTSRPEPLAPVGLTPRHPVGPAAARPPAGAGPGASSAGRPWTRRARNGRASACSGSESAPGSSGGRGRLGRRRRTARRTRRCFGHVQIVEGEELFLRQPHGRVERAQRGLRIHTQTFGQVGGAVVVPLVVFIAPAGPGVGERRPLVLIGDVGVARRPRR